jgi:hypothetical protein
MRRIAAAFVAAAALALAGSAGGAPEEDIVLDFSTATLPAGWTVGPASWKVEGGELRGTGSGGLVYAKMLSGDFRLTLKVWTEEKASIEVHFEDAKGERTFYTCGFGGLYHPVLDGVKSCILRDDRFVAVDPRMWIFPGRMWTFEVRHAKHQWQMFLNGVLGPVFVDDAPDAASDELRLHILATTEGAKDKVRIDDVRISERK